MPRTRSVERAAEGRLRRESTLDHTSYMAGSGMDNGGTARVERLTADSDLVASAEPGAADVAIGEAANLTSGDPRSGLWRQPTAGGGVSNDPPCRAAQ